MSKNIPQERCPTCGSPVTIEGHTTKHYVPVKEIPQDVRERIEKEAEKCAFRVPYDGSNNFYDDSAYKGYIAGAESEHLRSAERISELEKALRDMVGLTKSMYDGQSWFHFEANSPELLKAKALLNP